MRRSLIWFLASAVLGTGLWGMVNTSTVAAIASPKVLRHLVLYKFRDDVSAQQVQEVVDAFAALPKQIEGIVAFEAGTNVSSEGKSEGLTHCFQVTFRDQEALDAYLKHPAHDKYVQVVKPRREKVVVFDYWTPAP
jgi:quinol monooxygenase YgiN